MTKNRFIEESYSVPTKEEHIEFTKQLNSIGRPKVNAGELIVSLDNGWFRVFGWGLAWKDTRKHSLLFSERELGHGLQVWHWRFKVLKPW